MIVYGDGVPVLAHPNTLPSGCFLHNPDWSKTSIEGVLRPLLSFNSHWNKTIVGRPILHIHWGQQGTCPSLHSAQEPTWRVFWAPSTSRLLLANDIHGASQPKRSRAYSVLLLQLRQHSRSVTRINTCISITIELIWGRSLCSCGCIYMCRFKAH